MVNRKNKANTTKTVSMYAILLIIILGALYFSSLGNVKVHEFTYDEFLKNMSKSVWSGPLRSEIL